MLRSVSWYSKVHVPRWTPFCYILMNKHKNRKLSIYAAESELRMYIKKGHKQAIKRFHRNQKAVGMAVINKVRKQYPTLSYITRGGFRILCKGGQESGARVARAQNSASLLIIHDLCHRTPFSILCKVVWERG